VGFGGARGREILVTICGVCDDAIKALSQGLDVDNRPINSSQIADGLKRLVQDARNDTGLVATVLNPKGIRLYSQCLDELERIAQASLPTRPRSAPAKLSEIFSSFAVGLICISVGIYACNPGGWRWFWCIFGGVAILAAVMAMIERQQSRD
jgi:hypothetical protein